MHHEKVDKNRYENLKVGDLGLSTSSLKPYGKGNFNNKTYEVKSSENFIDEGKKMPTFPFICLTVSGGHTQIVLVKGYFDMEVRGETLDDAAGEAFDKSAKILGLEYPGGPLIDKYASKGNHGAFKFTKPRVGDLKFSFSGLKTSVLYQLEELQISDYPDVAASFQEAVIDILAFKLFKASKQTGIKKIICSGGVAANKNLRQVLKQIADEEGIEVFYPKLEYCTDNAAMIAYAGFIRKKYNLSIEKNIFPRPRWAVEEI